MTGTVERGLAGANLLFPVVIVLSLSDTVAAGVMGS